MKLRFRKLRKALMGARGVFQGLTGRVSKPLPGYARGRPFRPDRPSQSPGRLSYDQIEYVMMDAQVRVAYQTIEALLLSREFILTRPDESEESRAVYDFIDTVFKSMKTDMRTVRRNLYQAFIYGSSVNEVLYEYMDGRVGISDILPLHPSTIHHDGAWVYDEGTGELLGVRQDLTGASSILYNAGGAGDLIPVDKLLIYSFNPPLGEVEGSSILTEIYDHVDMKQSSIKWLLVYLQKYENPVLIGKASNPQYKDELLSQLELIEEGLSKITIGREDEVQVVESQHRGDAFFEFIKYNDNMILRRFFLGTLLFGQSDKASGSYSQSQTQLEVSRLILDGVHMDIARAIQGLINRLVAWNFGEEHLKYAPRAEFESLEEKDLHSVLQTLQPYASSLIIDPTSEWFQGLLEAYVNRASGLNLNLVEQDAGDEALEDLPPGDDETTRSLTETLQQTREAIRNAWKRHGG